MGQWLRNRRERFLDELLRLEGRGDHRWQTKCSTCPEVVGMVYRCRDCFTDALFCQPCVVTAHKDNPLHRVEMWRDGHFFEGVSLKSLGLRIQLGHGRNGTCTGTLARAREEAVKPLRDDFCIIDSNGVHKVALDFCSCSRAEDHDIQLLRARLYPATTTNPVMAATFRVLRDFHLLSLEAKSSAHHFYNKLARQTNNNGVFQPRTRYAEFRRMARQWRNLQMFKRAGRGHAADGIAGTKAGECALLCPACPQPGKNLPRDGSWKVVPRERRFLYALFLALDANFRMKRKDVSSEADDPSLGDGVAFFSQVDEYMRHLESHWDLEQEKSTCVAHDAVDEPNREAHGTAASGIGTVDCTRHNMKRPNGVTDLQKGKKYINMDYMLWKSLENDDEIIQLFISYDIVCQWSKNIWRRLAQYNPELRQSAGNPKDRYYACNILFSFNLTPYVGQTDGEAPERGWANTNPLATSTKEMGPGARRDALDDHFNDWNHKKIVGLGKFLLERAKKAVDNMTTCRLELLETELGLPREAVEKWTREMELWELDDTNPNPFKIVEKHEGIFAIRGRLAEQASTAVAGDAADDVRGDLHAHEMVDMGMQLEQQQRNLAFDAGAVKLHATDHQKTALEDEARAAAARLKPTPAVPVHATQLWLPSKLITVKPSVAVKPSHARYEFELRVGQAHAALEELRRLLLVRTAKYHYKDQFERGVSSNTRAKTSIQNVDERIRRTAAGYRVARLVLVNLGPMLGESAWKNQLRVLAADDVRQRPRATFSDPEHKMRKKRRKRADPRVWAADARQKRDEERTASWIWMSQLSAEEEETGMADALRVEWAKTRAKAWRWTEEVDLVEEEMRRVVAFLEWKAERWAVLRDERCSEGLDEITLEGLSAYAQRQAQIQLDLRDVFSETWKDIPRYIALGRDTLGKIPPEQEESGEGVDAEGKDEDEEGDEEDDEAPVAETAPNPKVAASFVEESLV
ncbi:hypothetical protein B0H14DRAFT_3083030 [Mycena olivaceomarginata]|nr:hypothetical protein B0H14DRAFT_3083030 [Mycena olivaceomarginata]